MSCKHAWRAHVRYKAVISVRQLLQLTQNIPPQTLQVLGELLKATAVWVNNTYQGAKNSTIQSSLLLSTNSSKLWEFNSTDALGSDLSLDPPADFPFKRSFRSAFTCTRRKSLNHKNAKEKKFLDFSNITNLLECKFCNGLDIPCSLIIYRRLARCKHLYGWKTPNPIFLHSNQTALVVQSTGYNTYSTIKQEILD